MSLDIGRLSSRWMHVPRLLLPSLITIVLLIAQLLPWNASVDAMTPSFALMATVFWSLRTPKIFPPLFAFLIGGIADLTELTPLGSQAVVFLILRIELARRTRFNGLSFVQLWVFFAAIYLGASLIMWLVELVIGGRIMPLGQMIERTAIAIAIFPIVVRTILMPLEHLVKGERNG
jgi:rod shape-determining protein MreD